MFINWAAISDAHHQEKHGATETQIPAGQSRLNPHYMFKAYIFGPSKHQKANLSIL